MFRFFCASADQKRRVLSLTRFAQFEVSCVSLRNMAPLKGLYLVSCGKWMLKRFKNIPGVIDACQMNRVVKEEKLKSLSVL